jgi:hypothetical protein
MQLRPVVAVALLFVVVSCNDKRATAPKQRSKNALSERAWSQPRLGIDVVAHDRDITFRFTVCGARNGAPFVDRLIVEKTRPTVDKGIVCEFESESDESVLRDQWQYGEARRGVGRCWPLTEGEYVVVGIGSGTGETRFALTTRWFRSGYTVRILESSCEQS